MATKQYYIMLVYNILMAIFHTDLQTPICRAIRLNAHARKRTPMFAIKFGEALSNSFTTDFIDYFLREVQSMTISLAIGGVAQDESELGLSMATCS